MKKAFALLCLVILANSSYAKTVTKELKVLSATWDGKQKLFRVGLFSKAGVYWAEKKDLECLRSSIHSKSKVHLDYDVHSLRILKCRK